MRGLHVSVWSRAGSQQAWTALQVVVKGRFVLSPTGCMREKGWKDKKLFLRGGLWGALLSMLHGSLLFHYFVSVCVTFEMDINFLLNYQDSTEGRQ